MPSKILIVEDSKINCLVYAKMFTPHHYELSFAYDGLEGLNAFNNNSYDLIILDIGLPKILGYELANMIRMKETQTKVIKPIPIIAVSADSSYITKERAFLAGVNEYVTKPFNIQSLKEMINKYLTQ
jgi:CheY-like chemotaxis protein